MSNYAKRRDNFFTRAKEAHGEKFDYSKVDYVNSRTPIEIICPVHGSFFQKPSEHVTGRGCKACYMDTRSKKIRFEKFLKNANKKHNNKYTYIEESYIEAREPIRIICPIHGEFVEVAARHIKISGGCKQCNKEAVRQKRLDKFLKRSKKVHNDFFTYKVETYKTSSDNMTITCPYHGDFEQLPMHHQKGVSCPECSDIRVSKYKDITLSMEQNFINFATKLHLGKYTYIKGTYKNSTTKLPVICPIHGKFMVSPSHHTHDKKPIGCPKCGILQTSITRYNKDREQRKEKFLKRARKTHGDRFEYLLDSYDKTSGDVTIVCKTHGQFKQTGSGHLSGSGCPACAKSNISQGETRIRKYLDEKGINYETEKTFEGLKNEASLRFDFFIPSLNLLIEYDGRHHFVDVYGKNSLKKIQKNDKIKDKWVQKQKGLVLLRIPYTSFNDLETILDKFFQVLRLQYSFVTKPDNNNC